MPKQIKNLAGGRQIMIPPSARCVLLLELEDFPIRRPLGLERLESFHLRRSTQMQERGLSSCGQITDRHKRQRRAGRHRLLKAALSLLRGVRGGFEAHLPRGILPPLGSLRPHEEE